MTKENVFTMGTGTPVVLLHSAMSSKLQWYRLMSSMSHDHLLVAVDFYGYGDSPFPDKTENFYLSDEIDLVESLIQGIIPADEPFHLVGHSYGGAVGLRYSYKAPERIRSLSVYEPVAFHLLRNTAEYVLNQVRQQYKEVCDYVNQGNYAGASEFFIDHWNGPGTFSGYPKEVQILLSESVKKLPLGFNALVNEPLSLTDYTRLEVPVCLVAGEQSPIHSRCVAELLGAYLPNCKLHWVKSGHMAPVTHPDLVNPIIASFIRAH